MEQLPEDVKELLESIFKKSLSELKVSLHDPNRKGAGHLGEFFFVSLSDTCNNLRHEIAVKRSLTCQSDLFQKFLDSAFSNEIYFYKTLLPNYKRLEERFSTERFDKTPHFYGANEKCTILVLNNLKLCGYGTHDKQKPLEKQHYDLIFETYGKLHALSFALRELDSDGFLEAKEFLKVPFVEDFKTKSSAELQEDLTKWMGNSEKLKKVVGNITENLREAYVYAGENEVLLHGDCWSNNIMFKYNESNKVEDIKLVDFQLCRVGTPVFDLSYCFYSGASEELLAQLDYFLDIYHGSLSQSLRQFDLDPAIVYPMSTLRTEWKKYCRYGFCSAMTIWKVKLASEEDALDMTKSEEEIRENFGGDKRITEEYLCKIQELVHHMRENGFA
ncbi:unnamed protein product [Acanthoscelides obtectus]|uniref:CHK kinase-like domain-containing protein n=1 Tax=Acanthoscelides obtectus TaxID=200917 RepID=A0A9P0KHS6_ACAOB|nr:unnamed protein product [Acanthoscelides obtectus]CAK1670295.1 hypothetical protein AOBTE_LOCUS27537 [Acanthoscelides obtectus]